MNDNKVVLSERTARAMFHDVALSNLWFAVAAVAMSLSMPWLWLQIIFWIFAASSIIHIFQAKKILIKGKLFRLPKRKVKKDDGSKRS